MATLKRNKVLDIAKYILSIMVVAMHTNIWPEILFPWLSTSMQLFFMISSFLLFEKMKYNKDKEKEIIKNYILRIIKLYLFWFIALLPFTLYKRRSWFDKGLLLGIIKTVRKILFSSTFTTSWFLVATIWASLFLYLTRNASKKKNSANYCTIIFNVLFIWKFLLSFTRK